MAYSKSQTKRGGRSRRNRLVSGGLLTEALAPLGLLGLQKMLSRNVRRSKRRKSRKVVKRLRRTRRRM